jgi:hypothetical protein
MMIGCLAGWKILYKEHGKEWLVFHNEWRAKELGVRLKISFYKKAYIFCPQGSFVCGRGMAGHGK